MTLLGAVVGVGLVAGAYLFGRRHGRRQVRTTAGRQRAGWRAPRDGGYRPAVSTPEPTTPPRGRAGASPLQLGLSIMEPRTNEIPRVVTPLRVYPGGRQ